MTLVCAALLALVGAGSASAHAALISTDPGQGAVVATVPATVSLTFGESVVVAADGVRVFAPDGTQVDTGHATHLGAASMVGVGLRGATRPGGTRQGTYTVAWRVISADSHPVAGAFTFSVGHPSASRAPSTTESGSTTVGVLYGITRAVEYASFALLAGSIAFVLLCWPSAIARWDVRRVMLVGWAALVAATMAALVLQGPYGYGLGPGHLFDSAVFSETLSSRLGTALLVRFMLLALTGGYLVLLCAWLEHYATRGRGWFGALGVALAVGLASTWSASGHAAVGIQPALAFPVDVVHLLAMGVWLGGLVTLVAVLRNPVAAGVEVSRAVSRFSSIATGSVVVLIGTGSYQSWRQLGSWAAFVTTDYGRLLLVKLGVFALLLSVAAFSRRWIIRHRRAPAPVGAAPRSWPAMSTLRRSVLREAALGAFVLAVTALLVNAEPGRTATAAPLGPVHRVVSFDTGGPGGRGQVAVDVEPAATGPNTIRVTVEDPAGRPHDVPEVGTSLTLAARQIGPVPVPLHRTAPGVYVADGVQIPNNGSWQLAVTVRTSDIDETTVAAPIDVR
ncbi:MAG: copper resistance protein CopC [Pseudonocardiaceae bacterium]